MRGLTKVSCLLVIAFSCVRSTEATSTIASLAGSMPVVSMSITRTIMTLEARRVYPAIALKNDGKCLLHRCCLLGQAFHLDEHVLLVATPARSTSAPHKRSSTRQHVCLTGVGEFSLCHKSAPHI